MGQEKEKQQEAGAVLRLASASPRRRQLLELIGVPHVVSPADIDETPQPGESAPVYVTRLAKEKATRIWSVDHSLPVLAADTTVTIDGEIFGKPESEHDALHILGKLSGRVHSVVTGICVLSQKSPTLAFSHSEVTFRRITRREILAYWASGEPRGKAGAYAIQGLGAVFVEKVSGSYTGVMGLPLFETAEALRTHDVPVWNGALVSGGD
jgi:septum formation protein